MSYYIYEILQAYDKITNDPISPAIYKKGKKVKDTPYDNSIECNADTVKWEIDPYNYICDNGEKYEKYIKYVLSPEGWVEAEPQVYKQGDLLESDSQDCGVTWELIDKYVCEEVE